MVASLFGAGRPLILGAQVGYSSGENVPWGAPAARLSSSRRVSFLLFQSANAALVARRAFGLALALAWLRGAATSHVVGRYSAVNLGDKVRSGTTRSDLVLGGPIWY